MSLFVVQTRSTYAREYSWNLEKICIFLFFEGILSILSLKRNDWKLFCLMLLYRRELSLSFSISFLVFILLFHKQTAKNVIRIVCWKTTKNYRSLPPRSFPFVFFFRKSTEENAENSISETMNSKIFWRIMPLVHLVWSAFGVRRSNPFSKSRAKATASRLRLEWRLGLM